MEIRVHNRRERPDDGARKHAERVGGRDFGEPVSARELERRGLRRRESGCVLRQVGGRERRTRAIHEAEVGKRLRHVVVHVPTAAGEELWLESALTEPVDFPPNARRGPLAARRRARMARGRPVRVQAERPP